MGKAENEMVLSILETCQFGHLHSDVWLFRSAREFETSLHARREWREDLLITSRQFVLTKLQFQFVIWIFLFFILYGESKVKSDWPIYMPWPEVLENLIRIQRGIVASRIGHFTQPGIIQFLYRTAKAEF